MGGHDEREMTLNQLLVEMDVKVCRKNSAAEILGLDLSTLRACMRKLDIRKP